MADETQDQYEFVVESGIPVPSYTRKSKYPWDEMVAGDSFYVPPEDEEEDQEAVKARMTAVTYSNASKRGFQGAVRYEADGVRVWFLEPSEEKDEEESEEEEA